jgi:hypothetical protein
VRFPDGHIEEYVANVVAENLLSQVDDEGHHHVILSDNIDHCRKPQALSKDYMWITSHNGNRSMRKTTKGWDISIQWRDDSTSWEPLKNIKESNPIQLAEYAVANKIADETAFAWWIYEVLKRQDRMMYAIKTRYKKRTHNLE